MDCERAAINAVDATFHQAAAAGCYFHLGQSVYRRVQGLGLAEKFGAGDEFKRSAKKLTALAFFPPSSMWWVGSNLRKVNSWEESRN